MTHYLRLSFKYKNNELWETDQVYEKSDQVYDKDFLTKKGYKKIMILEFCKTPRTLNEIMYYVKVSHKPTFRKNYLISLLQNKQLEMTIPDKPNSSKQKYITINKGEMKNDKNK